MESDSHHIPPAPPSSFLTPSEDLTEFALPSSFVSPLTEVKRFAPPVPPSTFLTASEYATGFAPPVPPSTFVNSEYGTGFAPPVPPSTFVDSEDITEFVPPETMSFLNNDDDMESTAFLFSTDFGDPTEFLELQAQAIQVKMPVDTKPTELEEPVVPQHLAQLPFPKATLPADFKVTVIENRVTQPPDSIVPISLKPEPKLSIGHPRLEELVLEAFDNGYSDIHLGVGEAPRFRNRGEIEKTNHPITDELTFRFWLHEFLTEAEIQSFEKELDYDAAIQYPSVRVRVNIFDSLYGYSMVLRLIPMQIASLEEMKLPKIFQEICHAKKGLILITGPTGSGKSTSMAAMVDHINKTMPRHIVTIEDPVEFVHKSKMALIKHREVGRNTSEFERALKAVLREDPDVILIGEIRDVVTATTALKAAQTGHLIIGTLHTNSAVKTIDRFLTLFKSEEIPSTRVALAESLIAVISQGLCRTTDGRRSAYHDIMYVTEAIKDSIAKGDNDAIEPLMKDGEMYGMKTTNQSLFELYLEGRITEETALALSPSESEMAILLRGGSSR